MTTLLSKLADELLTRDITEPSAVLGSFSEVELDVVYDAILEQFALELLIGAHENSEWSHGKLVIAGNRGNIHCLRIPFFAGELCRGKRHCRKSLGW
jgi:hypothetical protein